MRGGTNAHELGDAVFVRRGAAVGFSVDDRGEYPVMTHGDGRVVGEVWDVRESELVRLDAFEGDGYRRESITLEDGTTAFAYVGRQGK